jgi:hypothetical protein
MPAAAGAPVGPPNTLVRVAGVVLAVCGGLATLFGLIFVVGGGAVGVMGTAAGDTTGLAGLAGGAIAIFGVVIVIIGVLQLAGGVGIWRGRNWGRVTGIVFGVLGVLAGLGTMSGQGGAASGIPILAAYGYVLAVLLVYWRRSPAGV